MCVCVRERERTQTRTLYCIKHLGCMYKGGSNKQFNSSSDISFGKSLSKLYTLFQFCVDGEQSGSLM